MSVGSTPIVVGDLHRGGSRRHGAPALLDAREQARVVIPAAPVGARLGRAVDHRDADGTGRPRELRAVLDQVDGRGGFGQCGQRRRRTHDTVLHLLQHERGVRGCNKIAQGRRASAGG